MRNDLSRQFLMPSHKFFYHLSAYYELSKLWIMLLRYSQLLLRRTSIFLPGCVFFCQFFGQHSKGDLWMSIYDQ